jgi:glyceraldehyde 3-phosphate dehydrogenase
MGKKGNINIGINGFGRIGKLTLWHLVTRKYFNEIFVNIGRESGSSIKDIADYVERDSTYGSLERYLFGHRYEKAVTDIDESNGSMIVNGVKVTFLRKARNPAQIDWKTRNVELVIDTTGKYNEPAMPDNKQTGCLSGHFEAGAKKVIISAPCKITGGDTCLPDDVATVIMGINEESYDPSRHRIISAGSCTTTCLAHMMKPLLDIIGPKRILTVAMSTIHAVTGGQPVLDRVPKAGATDLRKTRGVFNNIILTTTGAASTLALVLPEMKDIGFMAESVRIPATTGSLIILSVNIQEEESRTEITRDFINDIYKKAASADPRGYLIFTDEQNVSGDIISLPNAGAIIEGHETRTKTAELTIDRDRVCGIKREHLDGSPLRIPLTQSVIYGWYDNEMGGFVYMLGELAEYVAERMT